MNYIQIPCNAETKPVFDYFQEICAIPHGSGNCGPIADYLESFAKKHGIEYHRDTVNNVIMVRESTPGYENAETVILQGHVDMVCEKTADREIDFLKDGLELFVDGDWLRAKGTSLGGDDGIAVAMMLAFMAGDYPAPRVECVFTVEEETGMDGAVALETERLKGRKLVNLDSEEEGTFTVGCAGGAFVALRIPVARENKKGVVCKLAVDGLKGGHSGQDIDKGRGNAILLLGRALHELGKKADYSLVSLSGGGKANVIPSAADAELVTAEENVETLNAAAEELQKVLRHELDASDADVSVRFTAGEADERSAMTAESTKKTTLLLISVINGVQAMSMALPGLTQTSLNVGVLSSTEDTVETLHCLRSSIGTEKFVMVDRLGAIAKLAGAEMVLESHYPAWEYRKDSPLRELMREIFVKQYGYEPRVSTTHAGLECGLFGSRIEGLDCVSIGPDLPHIHSVEERLGISSAERVWAFTLELLKESK